jgi:hypothetical protein
MKCFLDYVFLLMPLRKCDYVTAGEMMKNGRSRGNTGVSVGFIKKSLHKAGDKNDA